MVGKPVSKAGDQIEIQSMKQIPLNNGYVALVDDEDFERVQAAGPWRSAKLNDTNVYAVRTVRVGEKRTTLLMHRLILGFPESRIDHRNHNGLDNQRHNLRVATALQNVANRRKGQGSSQYKGVSWVTRDQLWIAQIGINGRKKRLGGFLDEVDAALAYDAAAKQAFGEFAHTNLGGSQ